jgi:Na+/melibiose symporter-like transporter
MTVRTAEIVFAVLLALCSIGLMVKSAELNIGWIEGRGPGSGAWPFWLSTGMLLCCIWTIVRWFRKITPESVSEEPYISADTAMVVGVSAFSILALLVLTQWAGIYIALPVFLFFYLKFIGHHSWVLTLTLVVCVPVFIFCLFEWALKIPLPKAFTEEAFYPVYDLIYAQSAKERLGALTAPVVGLPALAVLISAIFWLWYAFTRKSRQAVTSEGAN